MKQLPSILSKAQYEDELKNYLREQLLLVEGKQNLKFWVGFNKSKQQEFNDFLSGAGVTVLEN